jgi:hypothetical protein
MWSLERIVDPLTTSVIPGDPLASLLKFKIRSHSSSSTTHREVCLNAMAILRTLMRTAGVLTGLGTGALGYLGASTTIISPIPADDPIWASNNYSKYNPHRNPPTQDICVKRIPLRKIKPELLEKEGDLALELCRGVWGGLGKY